MSRGNDFVVAREGGPLAGGFEGSASVGPNWTYVAGGPREGRAQCAGVHYRAFRLPVLVDSSDAEYQRSLVTQPGALLGVGDRVTAETDAGGRLEQLLVAAAREALPEPLQQRGVDRNAGRCRGLQAEDGTGAPARGRNGRRPERDSRCGDSVWRTHRSRRRHSAPETPTTCPRPRVRDVGQSPIPA
jgi:hypothetical protein